MKTLKSSFILLSFILTFAHLHAQAPDTSGSIDTTAVLESHSEFVVKNYSASDDINLRPDRKNVAEAVYEPGPAMKSRRHNHHVVKLPDGKVALIAGRTAGFVSLNTTEIFDPVEGTFTTLAMQYTHDSPTVAKMNSGRYLIAGGSRDLGIPSYDQTEIFDPSDISFTSTGSMIRFRASGGAAALNDGRVVVASAWWVHNDAHTYGELYNPDAGTFNEIGPFTISRSRGVVIPTNDGQALLLGGGRPTGNWENMPVELYNPQSGDVSVLHEYIVDDDAIVSFLSGQAITAHQQLANDSYLWMAQNLDNNRSYFDLITVNPETKAVEVFETTPPLPDSESFSFMGHPVIDNDNNRAYLLARVNNTS
jgi:hypothetical protein